MLNTYAKAIADDSLIVLRTFNPAIVPASLIHFLCKSLNGNNHLGGEDFDNRLINYCINQIKNKTSLDINIKNNPETFQKLKSECEKAKITLSSENQAKIKIYSLIDISVIISRSKFEALCMDLFYKCISSIENALKDAKMSKNQIDDIILVGGSSHIPKIQEMIKKYFDGKKLNIEPNPKEAVAYGAAIQAAIMTNVQDDNIERLILIDMEPYSLGIETTGGVMNVIIPKNSALPCKHTQTFSTDKDNQNIFSIKVYEGNGQLTKDNYLLGKFELLNLK